MKQLKTIIALVFVSVICFILLAPKRNYTEQLSDYTTPKSKHYREIRKNGYVIKVQYLPVRYFELRQLAAYGDTISDERQSQLIEEARRSYGKGLYFMVTLAHEDNNKDVEYEHIGNFGDYSAQLQKFLFEMGDYVYLQTAQENEIKLSVYDFERTFGLTKDRKMLLCFPKEFNGKSILDAESEYLRMHFKEFGFGIGKQTVEWKVKDLN